MNGLRNTIELLDQPPPQDLDAEKAVLASIILDREVLEACPLRSGDFFLERHQKQSTIS